MAFMPMSPPPLFVPEQPATSYIVDCLYQQTYVWLWNGESFWFYPTQVESGGVSGYRWDGRFWIFYRINPRLIKAVSCPPIPTLY